MNTEPTTQLPASPPLPAPTGSAATLKKLADREADRLLTYARQHGEAAALRMAADDIAKLRRAITEWLEYEPPPNSMISPKSGAERKP